METALRIFVMGLLAASTTRADDMPPCKRDDVELSAEKLGRVKTIVQRAIDKGQTAGMVVLIARHGKVPYLEAFGQISASKGKPMTEDAIFRIYSMTKPITTVAALLLYEAGKFRLDDPVSSYLSEFKALRVPSS
jgi:CubicO group peptidase (beta-lactamase class C family)